MHIPTTAEAYTNYPIVAALVAAEEILGANRTWSALNNQQASFLAASFASLRDSANGMDFIKSKVSWNVGDINKFLAENGFTIELQPLAPNEFGFASILDLLVEWAVAGYQTQLQHRITGTVYPAAELSEDTVSFYELSGHDHPIVALSTKSEGIRVFMSIAEGMAGGLDLIIRRREFSLGSYYSGLVFPMVDMRVSPDVSWLVNMSTVTEANQPARLTQALLECRLRMNHLGARAQAAFAGSGLIESTAPPPNYRIDLPFIVWFEKAGEPEPVFMAFVDEGSWKDPGGLG